MRRDASRGPELRKFVAPEIIFGVALYTWLDNMDATSVAAKHWSFPTPVFSLPAGCNKCLRASGLLVSNPRCLRGSPPIRASKKWPLGQSCMPNRAVPSLR